VGSVGFWDAVDIIGVDAYFPLAENATSDVDELVAAWTPIRDRLAATSHRYGKPVLFTEVGYRSQAGAATEPYAYDRPGPPDEREQAAAYLATLRVFTGQPWWAGAHWWMWAELPSADLPSGTAATSYSPRGKLAESVLREYWAVRR
jgi:hypothetical protein